MKNARSTAVLLHAGVLLVGDSHTYQSFGRNLDSLLRTLPHAQVATYASWGSSPDSWFTGWVTSNGYFAHDPDGRAIDIPTAPTPFFAQLLTRFNPAVTIIALGSNLYSAPADYVASNVREILGALKTRAQGPGACLWVGPPDMRLRAGPQMVELYDELKTNLGTDCRLLDSRSWTRYPDAGGDGIHYDYLGPEGIRQAEAWAEKVFEAARETLSGPVCPELKEP